MEVFTWRPRVNAQGAVKFRVLTAGFGDGYTQTAADGINNKVQSWPLQFVGKEATVAPIAAFLDRHAGYRSFLWTPPLGQEGYYTASEYQVVALGGGAYTVSATFQQVFRP
ncbi:phage tail protein [Achromobacter sp.]|uniref:phage tail protein n=1 Tax=Achromobacter sp. TaxID=134375 RepID=UPI000EC06507|nr:phage tail protein [Achromobacter sp.]HCW18356.1 phage tail protein [Achromobacter sp.]